MRRDPDEIRIQWLLSGQTLTLAEMLNFCREMRRLRGVFFGSEPPGADLELIEDLSKAEAIISSMTPFERQRPELINESRRVRIARGSGTRPSDVVHLIEQLDALNKIIRDSVARFKP